MSFPRYSAYKDSGVEWLGEVPQGWGVWKLSHFAPIITCGVAATPEYLDDGVIFLSAQNIKRRKINLEVGHKYISQDKHDELTKNRSPIKGDILLSRVGTIGEVCIVDVDYPFSIFVSLTHIRLDQKICINSFFVYVTQSAYVKALHTAVTLVGGGVGNLNVNDLREYQIILPPLPEQTTIAAFLDCETAKIDNLINEQKKLIELLKEKRQAVISTAVTKGLNPHAPMKDSGVEWLGEVPEHWEVFPLKNMCELIKDGTHLPPPRVADGIPLLSVRNISNNGFFCLREDDSLISIADYNDLCRSFTPQKNDIILAIVGATLGKTAVIPDGLGCFQIQRSVAIFRTLDFIKHSWLYFSFVNDQFQKLLWQYASFSAQPGIYLGTLTNFKLAFPDISEQTAILAFLDQETAKIDNLIQQAQKATTLLQERRTALISAAVTGKIDVRGFVKTVAEQVNV